MNARYVNREPNWQDAVLVFIRGTFLIMPYLVIMFLGCFLTVVLPNTVVSERFGLVVDWFDGPNTKFPKLFYFTVLCWLLGCGVIAIRITYLAILFRMSL
jgi:hypothetical protein